MNTMSIKKGDTVIVLSGKDKGKKGTVLEAMPESHKVVVEKVNVVSRHTKPRQQGEQGGIIKKEAPIHISNLNLVDPKTGKPTRIAIKRVDGKAVRISKKSNQEIK